MQRKVDLPTSEEIRAYVADFREFLEEGTFPERKALIRNFVQGIEVSGDEAELAYTIPMSAGDVTSERAAVLVPVAAVANCSNTPGQEGPHMCGSGSCIHGQVVLTRRGVGGRTRRRGRHLQLRVCPGLPGGAGSSGASARARGTRRHRQR